jgi:hypothetical protein
MKRAFIDHPDALRANCKLVAQKAKNLQKPSEETPSLEIVGSHRLVELSACAITCRKDSSVLPPKPRRSVGVRW